MKTGGVCLVLAIVIGTAYANTLGSGFVFDDYRLVVGHPLLKRTPPPEHLLFSPAGWGYRPVRNLSYLLDVRLGGMQPWIFHASNLFYHWLSACLVFLVAFRLTNPLSAVPSSQRESRVDPTWRYRPAVFIALLWAVHPVQTDAVAYISGRRDILGGLCLFAGFWAYLRYRAVTPPARGHYGWLFLMTIAYGLGLLSKESVLVLPVLCWLYDVHRGERVGLQRHQWAVYGLILALGACVLWYFAGKQLLDTSRHAAFFGGTFGAHVGTVARVWLHYLRLLVYPHPLLADYSYDAFPFSASLTESSALLAMAGVIAVAVGLVVLARRFPLCGYGGIWMLVSILPVSHIVPIQEVLAEHYLYVPLFGFCVIVGVLLDALCGVALVGQEGQRRWRPVLGYVLVGVLVAGAVARVVVRNRDWVNEETLWSTTILTAPRCVRAHYNLANVYKEQKRSADAAREFSAVLAIVPQHVGALRGFGELAFEAGLYGQALSYAGRAQMLAPLDPGVLYLLAWTHLGLKNLPEAEQFFQRLLSMQSRLGGVYRGLEAVAKERGDTTAAAQWAEQRLALEHNKK